MEIRIGRQTRHRNAGVMTMEDVMKKLMVTAAAALFAMWTSGVNALVIEPGDAVLSGTALSQAQINGIVLPFIAPSVEVYKHDVGSADEGSYAASYETTFMNTPSDPMDADIDYVGGAILSNATHLLVKGGGPPVVEYMWYLFDIAGWDGLETIEIHNFWVDRGAISHVTLYASATTVTEPGSLGVLGLTLIGIGLISRRRKTS